MIPESSVPSPDLMADPREIAKWTARYAKSRTIPFLIQWLFIVLLGVAIGGVVFITLRTYQSENIVWFLLCGAGIVGILVALAWFIVPQWGGERIYRISQWFYGQEGYAAYLGPGDAEEDMRAPVWIYVAGIGLALYHLAGAVIITMHPRWLGYMQPYSAVYMVPFFIAMTYSQRLGFWAYLWPALYGLHAVAVLFNEPGRYVRIHPDLISMVVFNMIVPVFGYGLIAILVGHIYSRYALHRLKSAVRRGLPANLEDESSELEDGDA